MMGANSAWLAVSSRTAGTWNYPGIYKIDSESQEGLIHLQYSVEKVAILSDHAKFQNKSNKCMSRVHTFSYYLILRKKSKVGNK